MKRPSVHQAMPSPRLTVMAPSIGSTGVQCLAVGTAFQMLPISCRSGLSSMSLPGAISRPVSPAAQGCHVRALLLVSCNAQLMTGAHMTWVAPLHEFQHAGGMWRGFSSLTSPRINGLLWQFLLILVHMITSCQASSLAVSPIAIVLFVHREDAGHLIEEG